MQHRGEVVKKGVCVCVCPRASQMLHQLLIALLVCAVLYLAYRTTVLEQEVQYLLTSHDWPEPPPPFALPPEEDADAHTFAIPPSSATPGSCAAAPDVLRLTPPPPSPFQDEEEEELRKDAEGWGREREGEEEEKEVEGGVAYADRQSFIPEEEEEEATVHLVQDGDDERRVVEVNEEATVEVELDEEAPPDPHPPPPPPLKKAGRPRRKKD